MTASAFELRFQRKAGEWLRAQPKAAGAKGSKLPNDERGNSVLPRDDTPTLEDLGIEKIDAHRWQRLAAVPGMAKRGKSHDEIERALQLETVPEPTPGRRTDITSVHDGPRLTTGTTRRLRAITRAPDAVKDAYREGRIWVAPRSFLATLRPLCFERRMEDIVPVDGELLEESSYRIDLVDRPLDPTAAELLSATRCRVRVSVKQLIALPYRRPKSRVCSQQVGTQLSGQRWGRVLNGAPQGFSDLGGALTRWHIAEAVRAQLDECPDGPPFEVGEVVEGSTEGMQVVVGGRDSRMVDHV